MPDYYCILHGYEFVLDRDGFPYCKECAEWGKMGRNADDIDRRLNETVGGMKMIYTPKTEGAASELYAALEAMVERYAKTDDWEVPLECDVNARNALDKHKCFSKK